MRKSNFLYGIAIVAVVGILFAFAGYTFSTHTPTGIQSPEAAVTTQTQTSATPTITPAETDGCGCCAGRRARLEKRRQQARERQLANTQNMSQKGR